MSTKLLYFQLVASCIILTSCGGGGKQEKVRDTPTSGTITISIDESLKPLVAAEKDTFEGLYDQAHLKTIYTSEDSAIASYQR